MMGYFYSDFLENTKIPIPSADEFIDKE